MGFQGLTKLGIKHFSNIFKDLVKSNLGETLKVIPSFPRMVEEEENEEFFKVVTKEELLMVLYSL